jgi:E3 ubiquitin-protein ligase RNF14
MTCWKCNTHFCWICNAQLNCASPYLHYQDPSSKCFQMLNHGILPNNADNDNEELENIQYLFEEEEDMIYFLNY